MKMTLDEMRKIDWTVSWSGGKDSTATVILCRKYNIPIKQIINVCVMYDDETPATLPVQTDFINRAAEIFRQWGYPTEIVKAKPTYKDLFEKVFTERVLQTHPERCGKKYGFSAAMRKMCPISSYKAHAADRQRSKEDKRLLGICVDEPVRLARMNEYSFSLLDTLGILEKDCFEICRAENLLSPHYTSIFARDGCFFCPNVKKSQIVYLKTVYPALYEKIRQDYLQEIENRGYVSLHMIMNNWYKHFYMDEHQLKLE